MYDKSKREDDPIILFADPPSLNCLCALDISVQKLIDSPSSPGNKFQHHIIRCRELIFTEPEIIGSPAFGVENTFHIILQQSLFKTGRLQSRFQKIGLQASNPKVVTPALYQSCLKYTILARMAPNWNKAGEWLIQGRDFLTNTGYANAVKMNLTVNVNEKFFALEATTIRFPALKVYDIDICPASYQNFKNNTEAQINHQAIYSGWCHVLPSMKKGVIVNISHKLPTNDGPFQSYKDIKRHWKNTYGYRLPESEEDLVFYQVHFKPLGDRLFTYPECCLRSHDIQKLPRVDPVPIITMFLKDLQSKVSSICGFPLRLQNKARCPVLGLCNSGQTQASQNLGNRKQNNKLIYRRQEDIHHLLSKKPTTATCSDLSSQQNTHSRRPTTATSSQQNTISLPLHPAEISYKTENKDRTTNNFSDLLLQQGNGVPGSNSSINSAATSQNSVNFPMPNASNSFGQMTATNYPHSDNTQCDRKIIPRFAPKAFVRQKSCITGESGYASKKIVPNFQAKKPPTAMKSFTLDKSNTSTEQSWMNGSQNKPTCSDDVQKRFKPGGDCSVLPTASVNTPVFSRPTFQKKPVSFSKQSGSNINRKTLHQNNGRSSQISTTCHDKGSRTSVTLKQNTVSSNPGGVTFSSGAIPSGVVDYTASDYPVAYEQSPRLQSRVVTSTCTTTPGTPSCKRPLSQSSKDDDQPKQKKPRSKPQVQTDLDVENLARYGQLNKVNTVTLIAWLKEKGISCKSKDKKLDIQNRVRAALQIPIPEE